MCIRDRAQSVVGSDLRQEDLDKTWSLMGKLYSFWTGAIPGLTGGATQSATDKETMLDTFRQLSEMFPDVFGNLESMYDSLIKAGMSHGDAVSYTHLTLPTI